MAHVARAEGPKASEGVRASDLRNVARKNFIEFRNEIFSGPKEVFVEEPTKKTEATATSLASPASTGSLEAEAMPIILEQADLTNQPDTPTDSADSALVQMAAIFKSIPEDVALKVEVDSGIQREESADLGTEILPVDLQNLRGGNP